ncbi:hypothetical protein ABR738_05665 [Streptomyces sp. Edi4]|uniref:hypothetical protein n=1 Tax=Streptomyces sp. Edi4 TaxID=3162527 RepID=UPI00330573C9
MGRGRASGTGTARLFVLCAVLLGLFSMHGAPASAAGGCHGEMAMAPPPSAAFMSMTHATVAAERLVARAAPVVTGAHGETCVSTGARERLPLAATGLLALLALVVLVVGKPAGPWSSGLATARRGPPRGGRGLLLQVCVART